MPTIITPDVDPDVILDGARAALIASATIASTLAIATNPLRIAPDVVEEGVTPPYIVLSLPSVVVEGAYNSPTLNALLDVGIYTDGSDTTDLRTLLLASIRVLTAGAWTITGFNLISCSMKDGTGVGFRPTTDVIAGRIRRGRQFTTRVRANKL